MGVRPNFMDVVRIQGAKLIVAGTSDDAPLPEGIHVFLEQDGHVQGAVAGGRVERSSSAWQAVLPAAGFHPGPALAFGVEMRTRPFMVSTWSEMVEIR